MCIEDNRKTLKSWGISLTRDIYCYRWGFLFWFCILSISVKAHHTQFYTKEQKVQQALIIKHEINKQWMKSRPSKYD